MPEETASYHSRHISKKPDPILVGIFTTSISLCLLSGPNGLRTLIMIIGSQQFSACAVVIARRRLKLQITYWGVEYVNFKPGQTTIAHYNKLPSPIWAGVWKNITSGLRDSYGGVRTYKYGELQLDTPSLFKLSYLRF